MRLPWKTELLRNFSLYGIYFLHSGCLSNFRLPWKAEGSLNLLHRIYIFYYSGILSNLHALSLKSRGALEISQYWIYVIHSGFLSNLRLPWKTELPRNFSLYGIYFYIQNFWPTCACPEKQSSPDIFTWIFEQHACARPEKQMVPWTYCTEYIFFIIQEFWVACAWPENQSCPGIFTVLNKRYTLRSFEQIALALKNRVALIFFTVLNMYFLLFRSFE